MLKIYKKNDMISTNSFYLYRLISLQAEISEDISLSFNDIFITDTSIDAITLHSANTILKNLLHKNQPLQTPVRKYIPRLMSTAKWLPENIILHYEEMSRYVES